MRRRLLTDRHYEVIHLLSLPGATRESVAEAMGITVGGLSSHIGRIYDRLDVTSMAAAVRLERDELVRRYGK